MYRKTMNTEEEDFLINDILEICSSDMNIEEKRKKLMWDIINPLVSNSNTCISISNYVEDIMQDQFDEACVKQAESGNYSWSTSFKIMMDKILNRN